MATISVVTRRSSGKDLIYLRIHHRDTTRYLSLGVKIGGNHWNRKRAEVRKSHDDHRRINEYVSEVRAEAEAAVRHFQMDSDLLMTAARLKDRIEERLQGTEQIEEFFAFADDVLAGYKKRGQIGTHKNYRSVINKFRRFCREELGREQLPFDGVTVRRLRKFRTWCASELGNRHNTVHKALSILRTFVYRAIKEGLMDQGDNPFFHIEFKRKKVKKPVLTLEEVGRLEALTLTGFAEDVRNWWMFSFYSGGLRFSDLALLQYKNLQQDGETRLISYEMQKNGERQTHKLVDPALAIVDQYRGEDPAPEDRVLNILDGYELHGEEDRRRAIESRNARANEKLKDLAAAADISKNLTMHAARRSVASHMLDQGWTIYEIKEALGHADVGQTEEYVRRLDRSQQDEKWGDLF